MVMMEIGEVSKTLDFLNLFSWFPKKNVVLKFKSVSVTQSNLLYMGHVFCLVHLTPHCVLSTHILNLTYVVLLLQRMEPVTVALSSKEIRVIKCNGVSPGQGTQKHTYTLPSEYLSHIVVLGTHLCIAV
jgi:hypothetical protein